MSISDNSLVDRQHARVYKNREHRLGQTLSDSTHFSELRFASNTIGLYVHIPWCLQKCAYCDFYSIALNAKHASARIGKNLLENYIGAIRKELQLRLALLAQADQIEQLQVDTLYFGGGTPSCSLD